MEVEFENVTSDLETPALRDLWDVYEKAFPIDHQRTPLPQAVRILRLIDSEQIQQEFGPYREFVVAIRDKFSRETVGGLVFCTLTSDEHLRVGVAASVQVVYYFRNQGEKYKHYRITKASIIEHIRAFTLACLSGFLEANATDCTDVAVFFEAENPDRMNEDSLEQEDVAGQDPWRRYRFWLRHGARPLDFGYIQPALDHEKQPIDYLDLFYIGSRREDIPSALLLRHLWAFFSVSIFEGKENASSNPHFAKMAQALRHSASIRLLNQRDREGILFEAMHRGEDAHLVQKLLLRPNEDLNIEYKPWLNLRHDSKKAELAKALIALTNHGGGYLVLGVADRGAMVSEQCPTGVSYGQERINQLVGQFAHRPFHCSTIQLRHPKTSVKHVVIRVPEGHTTPIFTKASISSNEITANACYVRGPGPESVRATGPEHWEPLIDRIATERRKKG